MDTDTYSVRDRAEAAKSPCTQEAASAQSKPSALCKSAVECEASGQGRTRRKLSLEWTYLGRSLFQLFRKEKNQQPFPNL